MAVLSSSTPPALIVFNRTGLQTATRLRNELKGAQIWGLAKRVPDADHIFTSAADRVQQLYRNGQPIIGLCAAGILIRLIAPLLGDKRGEPPVIAISEDGAIAVPLLGGLTGANDLAERIADILDGTAALTGSGARRFGIALEAPPEGYRLVNPQDAKRITSDLLAGAKLRLVGRSDWLEQSRLPFADDGAIEIHVTQKAGQIPPDNGLLYEVGISVAQAGRPPGSLFIVGLGPGGKDWLTPQARAALLTADDLVGYHTYLDLVPDLGRGWRRHGSDNRVELERAKQALDLALAGGNVALVTSGDPGIFAMAGTVMEALEENRERWQDVPIEIVPGISAMQAAAARTGAVLGHDFAVISLSDIRKPWTVIAKRLEAACKADMVIALYNPASKTRRQQIIDAISLLLAHRSAETPVVVARNLGREGEETGIIELQQLEREQIDMRTILLIGSSKSRTLKRPDGRCFVYTPRSYDE